MSTRSQALASAGDSMIVLIDCQERLWPHISGREHLEQRIEVLLQAAAILKVPLVVTEQYKKGLGPTVEGLRSWLHEEPIEKETFSCFGSAEFTASLEGPAPRQLILAGVEAHVCVLQTALDARAWGYEVQVVGDAVSSRQLAHRDAALQRMMQAGVQSTCVESLLFEWMVTCRHPEFRQVQGLLK